MRYGRIGLAAWCAALLVWGASGCRETTRHAGKALGVLSTCTPDCNGALPEFSCAQLAPALYAGGTAYCDATCTARFDGCEPHPVTDCDPLADNPCGAGRVCAQTGLDPNTGRCIDDPGATPSCSPQGATRCSGPRLERCTPDGWDLYEDCGNSGGVCRANPLGGGYRCASPTAGCSPGATRCVGAMLEICEGEGFVASEDCADDGGVCATDERGRFACVRAATDCDYSGIGLGTVTAEVFDDIAAAYYKRGASLISMSANTSIAQLSIELFGERGGPAVGDDVPISISLSGAESDYSTCSACVIATRRDGGRERVFMPIGGTLHITSLPAQAGDTLSFEVVDLALREVEIDPTWLVTRDVSGGSSWCFSSQSFSQDSSGYGCDANGSGACINGSERVVCSNGTLVREECDAGTVCRETGAGVSACSPPLERSECDITTHTPWLTNAYFDTDAWRYAAATSRGFVDDMLFVENFPEVGGRATPGIVSITGAESDRRTCTTCVWAGYGAAMFMARHGEVELSQVPTAPGDPFAVTVRNVEFHQVDANHFDIPGGLTWCPPSVTFGGSTGRYPCFGATYGNRTCAGDRLLECDLGNTWQLETDCAAGGGECVTSGTGVAACE